MLHKFLSIVDKNGRINKDLPKYSHLSQCWHHTRAAASHGYGQITINRQAWLTHRLSYHVHNGFPDLKSDQIVLHACDNKMCVNPDHLWVGTFKENSVDASRKNAMAFGERHGRCKLTETQVKKIISWKRGDNPTLTELAKRYGVSYSTVVAIRTGRNWKRTVTGGKYVCK